MNRHSRASRTALYYWPHLGIALGLALNVASLPLHDPDLIGIGGNVLTISLGVHLSRRRRERTSDTRRRSRRR